MARFDVHRHPDPKRRRNNPFFVSIQSDALDFLRTRIVVPLVATHAFGPRIPFLHPELTIDDQAVILATNELVAVERSVLGQVVANASADASVIVTALDYLVSGY